MKVVNNGLPEMIYSWLCQDFYDTEAAEGSISATSLKKPIQELLLVKRHIKEIEVDATDRIWSLFGSGIHAVLDKQTQGEQEERLFAEVEGRKISGKFDLVKNNTLYDYKTTSAWSVVFGSREEDWKFQLSVYRWLYFINKNILLNDKAFIIAIFRDWSEKNFKEGGKYPKLPIVEIPITLFSIDETQALISKQVKKIIKAEKLNDLELPKCSKDDRWWNEKKQEFMKCNKYCNAKQFCCQLKEYNKEKEIVENRT